MYSAVEWSGKPCARSLHAGRCFQLRFLILCNYTLLRIPDDLRNRTASDRKRFLNQKLKSSSHESFVLDRSHVKARVREAATRAGAAGAGDGCIGLLLRALVRVLIASLSLSRALALCLAPWRGG